MSSSSCCCNELPSECLNILCKTAGRHRALGKSGFYLNKNLTWNSYNAAVYETIQAFYPLCINSGSPQHSWRKPQSRKSFSRECSLHRIPQSNIVGFRFRQNWGHSHKSVDVFTKHENLDRISLFLIKCVRKNLLAVLRELRLHEACAKNEQTSISLAWFRGLLSFCLGL